MDNPTLRRLTGVLNAVFEPFKPQKRAPTNQEMSDMQLLFGHGKTNQTFQFSIAHKLPHKHRADSRHMVIAERLKKGDVLEVSQIKRDYPSWNDPYSPLTRAIEILKAEGVLVQRLNVGTHKRYYVEQ